MFIAGWIVMAIAAGCGGPADQGQSEALEPGSEAVPGSAGQGGQGQVGIAGAAGSHAAGAAGATSSGAAGEAGEAGAPNPSTPKTHVEHVEGVEVDTLAGSQEPGFVDGPLTSVRFHNPVNVLRDPDGDVFVSDFDNGAIRCVRDEEVVTVFEDPRLVRPFGLAMADSGSLYVEADGNTTGEIDKTTGTIWRIDPETGQGEPVTENAGRPRGMVVDADERLIIADLPHHVLRVLDPVSGEMDLLAGQEGEAGFEDGAGADARFDYPYGMAWLPSGEIVVADMENHAIRAVTPTGQVRTIAGIGMPGMVDGSASEAAFRQPKDVAVADDGTIYVSDTGNHRVRRISVEGTVRTVAGDGEAGYANGLGPDARFFGQEGLDLSTDGQTLIVADGTGGEALPYHRVRMLSLPGS